MQGERTPGAVASRSIDLHNSSQITYHERIADITTGSPLRLYRPEQYLECTAVGTGNRHGLRLLTAMTTPTEHLSSRLGGRGAI